MPFKKSRLANKHMKRCSIPLIRRKCNSKPGDVTSHPLGWLCIKIRKSQVWMRMERLEPLCGVGGDANWYHRRGTEYGGFSKNQKQNYPMIKKSHLWVSIQKWKQLLKERFAHTCVHSSIIHNRQEVQTRGPRMDGWETKRGPSV